MSLKSPLKKGDWIKARNIRTPGPELVGQATHDMGHIGWAELKVQIGDSLYETATINVNYWDVEPTHKNLITEETE